MEKDVSKRLRKAVKENNLFLVKRLCNRVDMRNPDPGPGRYTSLALAAVKGHEEIFDLFLMNGHDDEELSKDADNNTILILLAEIKLDQSNPRYSRDAASEQRDKAIRMARVYFERYPFTLDWSNSSGKTALHVAALKGNEEFIKMLLDVGADIDLPDMQGNTPLHYASAWGHLSIVQTLIERGCRYAARNNEGFMARDYAYSTTTMETLEDSARQQVEKNKRARQNARLAARAEQSSHQNSVQLNPGVSTNDPLGETLIVPPKGSMTSSTSSLPVNHSIPELPNSSSSQRYAEESTPREDDDNRRFEVVTTFVGLPAGQSALTPIASRVREKDADAIAQFMDAFKNTGTGSKSAIVDPGKPLNALTKHGSGPSTSGLTGARAAIHKLKQSVSLSQIRGVTSPSPQDGSSPSQIDIYDSDASEFAMTPKASPLNTRDSITPPATRRSPFNALISRTVSHQD